MEKNLEAQPGNHVELATEIVAAYVSNNSVPLAGLAELIASVHGALSGLGASTEPGEPKMEKATAARIRKSISDDALISFEDGRSYKTLRRHLTMRGLSPESYRAKYGLPTDYPMTSPAYSAQRSQLARSFGLGQQRRTKAPNTADVAESVSDASRGRPKASVDAEVALKKAKGRGRGRKTAEVEKES